MLERRWVNSGVCLSHGVMLGRRVTLSIGVFEVNLSFRGLSVGMSIQTFQFSGFSKSDCPQVGKFDSAQGVGFEGSQSVFSRDEA